MNYYFIDQVKDHLDFLGFNYYGSEYLQLTGIGFSPDTEYNDAGRAFDPNGLFDILKLLYARYNKPLYITENGTADQDDIFRSLYIVEHLQAIKAAQAEGVVVLGYIYWTLTDNFEWSDGYCPKFGLLSVDRESMLRKPRQSYFDFQNLIRTRKIDESFRDDLWKNYKKRIGQNRSMCRAANGKDGLDEPRSLPLGSADWRFKINL